MYTVFALWAAGLAGGLVGIFGGLAVYGIAREQLHWEAHEAQRRLWQEYVEAAEHERENFRRELNVALAVSENLDRTLADRLARKTAGGYTPTVIARKMRDGSVQFNHKRIHEIGLWRSKRLEGDIVEIVDAKH